jgi:ankyrin repeat protein
MAVYSGNIRSVEELVNNDRSLINVRERRGFTPLHYGAYYGHFEITQFLLDSGALREVLSNRGQTPYDMAKISRSNRQQMISLFEDENSTD